MSTFGFAGGPSAAPLHDLDDPFARAAGGPDAQRQGPEPPQRRPPADAPPGEAAVKPDIVSDFEAREHEPAPVTSRPSGAISIPLFVLDEPPVTRAGVSGPMRVLVVSLSLVIVAASLTALHKHGRGLPGQASWETALGFLPVATALRADTPEMHPTGAAAPGQGPAGVSRTATGVGNVLPGASVAKPEGQAVVAATAPPPRDHSTARRVPLELPEVVCASRGVQGRAAPPQSTRAPGGVRIEGESVHRARSPAVPDAAPTTPSRGNLQEPTPADRDEAREATPSGHPSVPQNPYRLPAPAARPPGSASTGWRPRRGAGRAARSFVANNLR